MSKKYLSCAETAKLVRAALKESFPGVKFSVTSDVYAGGASIRVKYKDGPTCDAVNAVAKVFEGAYFDGSIDYQGFNYSSLDGQEVSFGANFIFVNRYYTVEALTAVANSVAAAYDIQDSYEIKDSVYSGAYIDGANVAVVGSRYFNQAVNIAASEISLFAGEIQASKTLARVASLGDDGYGQGCTGRLATA